MVCYHILNGDSLAAVFPTQLAGEQIVARECLVDGDVHGETVEQLYATRSAFMIRYGEEYHPGDYEMKSIPQFESIRAIPDKAEINLWFEDDLFCQVNLWFVLYLLQERGKERSVYLVRPVGSMEFGFGGMSTGELIEAFQKRSAISIPDLEVLKHMWGHYQQSNIKAMVQIVQNFDEEYPFLRAAVQAHAERLSDNGKEGKPERVLREIMEELETREFGKVFREFCRREPIYGFGDLQVKRMWKEIVNNS